MNTNFKYQIKSYLIFVSISIFILLIYNKFSPSLTNFYFKYQKGFFAIELPFYILLSSTFYFSKLKNKFLKYIFPTIPLISSFLAFDIFYSFLSKSPRYSDFENISTIYDFDFFMFFSAILYLALIMILIVTVFIKAKKVYTKNQYITSLFFKLITLLCIILILQSKIFDNYQNNFFQYFSWSTKDTIKKNGRIASFIYYSKLENKNKAILNKQKSNKIDVANTLYKNKIKSKQNIYCVILESFINPNYITNANYNPNPISKELNQYLPNNDFSHLISPIYGGGTAQAEFELLSGIKAFAKVNSIEFNALEGNEIKSFLYQLKKNGYNTLATIGTNSKYYNSRSAYKSLGFNKTIFLEEEINFKRNKKDKKIFDGDLFQYNIKTIKKYLQNQNKPIFNYVLGMYGHKSYKRNKIDRPDVITLKNVKNDALFRISNQFYYRTKALAQYIKEILLLDPNALIIISSDHLPPILNDKNLHYKYDKYTNSALIIDKGKPLNIPKIHQYEVPWMIWDILSKSKVQRKYTTKTLEELYFKSLYNSLKR